MSPSDDGTRALRRAPGASRRPGDSMRRFGVLAAAVGLVTALVPATASAVGIGAFPDQVVIDAALRGGEYDSLLGLINDAEGPNRIALRAEGEVAPWITFRPTSEGADDLDVPLEVAAGERGFVTVRVTVPDDAANGTYTGRIDALLSPESGASDPGVVLGVGVSVPVTVTVGGTQRLLGSIESAVLGQTEVGLPLRAVVAVRNDGNVAFTPTLSMELFRDGETVDRVETTGPSVAPEQTEDVEVTWDTAEEPGELVARLTVSFREAEIARRDVRITVLPRGTLTRGGEITAMRLVGVPTPGGLASIEVDILNTGQVESRAVFIGAWAFEDRLGTPVTSLSRLVQPGEAATIDLFLDVPDAGAYVLEGSVDFQGAESGRRRLTVSVASPPATSDVATAVWLVLIAGSILALLWSLVRRVRERRERRESVRRGFADHVTLPGAPSRPHDGS